MPLSPDGMERKENLRATGAPVACATVLRWAPSRVTRRGALTATAAAAAAAAIFPSPPSVSPPRLSASSHRFDSVPFAGARSPLGPAGPVAPPPRGPWSRGSQSSPLRNTPSLFRLLPNAATDALLLLFLPFLFLSLSSFSGNLALPTDLLANRIYICIYILTLLWSRGRSEFSR